MRSTSLTFQEKKEPYKLSIGRKEIKQRFKDEKKGANLLRQKAIAVNGKREESKSY